ncbi:MAG: YIEGIA family protein [bacterium]
MRDGKGPLMLENIGAVILGLALGFLYRLYLLRIDYRQYPSYPHGYIAHLSLGFIAALLGAVALPALLAKEYAAVTFLSLAAQQFREIRNMERKTLEQLDMSELVPRGPDYIEGIARVFEGRNYLVMLVALATSSLATFIPLGWSAVGGIIVAVVLSRLKKGKTLGDIAIVRLGRVHFRGALLFVDDILIMNVGLKDAKKMITELGIGVVIEPKTDDARATLANMGQRQAINHEVATLLGARKDFAEPEFTPLCRLNTETGRAALFILPVEPDPELAVLAVRKVPVLESAIRRPLDTIIGRKASD